MMGQTRTNLQNTQTAHSPQYLKKESIEKMSRRSTLTFLQRHTDDPKHIEVCSISTIIREL